jgi:hypothetical protein
MTSPIQRLAELHAELMQARADLRLNERACPYQCHANEREYCKDLAELLRSEALDALPQMLALARAAEAFRSAKCELLKAGESPFAQYRPRYDALIVAQDRLLAALRPLTTSTPTEANAGEG